MTKKNSKRNNSKRNNSKRKNNKRKNNTKGMSINGLASTADIQAPELKLSLDNMELFYRDLYKQMRDNCPEVIVFEKNPTGEEIQWEINGDRKIAYLSQDVPDRQKLQLVMAGPPSTDSHHSARTGVARSCPDHSDLYGCAAVVSKILSIRCPQLVVMDSSIMGHNAGILLNNGDFPKAILIKDTLPFERKFKTIAHEMRHAWQHITNPSYYFADYHFSMDKVVEEYRQQVAEVDAEAFARAFCHFVFDTPVQTHRYSADTDQMINELAEKMVASPLDYGISIPGVSGGQRRSAVA